MNLRAPQTLVRVDVSHTTQELLIQQQSFDSRAARPCLPHKFPDANLQRVGTERKQFFRERTCRKISEPPESSRIGVAQLAIVVEQEARVSVFFTRMGGGIRRNLSGHSEVHEKRGRSRITVRHREPNAADRRETQQHELAITLDGFDLPAGEMLLKRSRVIDKIGFAQPYGQNPAAHNRAPQASRYCFDFGKFWHEGISNKIAHPLVMAQSLRTNPLNILT